MTRKKTTNQFVYISRKFPSGQWKIKVTKDINKNDVILKVSTYKTDIIASSVINSAIFYIETNNACNLKFE